MPLVSTTVTSPGAPVYAIPAVSSAARVCRLPSAPKSYAWLFARLTSRKPASRSTVAYPGGERKAKQLIFGGGDPGGVVAGGGHLRNPVSSVSGCSRLPIWMSARSTSATSAKKSRAPAGGKASGAEPMTMSPVADRLTVRPGSTAAGGTIDDGTVDGPPPPAPTGAVRCGAGPPWRGPARPEARTTVVVAAPTTRTPTTPRINRRVRDRGRPAPGDRSSRWVASQSRSAAPSATPGELVAGAG